MRDDLADKVILVTGAASGIGRATAILLARNGAKVIAADLNVESLDFEGEGGGVIAPLQANVALADDVAKMVAFAEERFGRLDGAVNNAGVAADGSIIEDMSLAAWQRTIDVNLTGVFLCLKHEIAAMRRVGGGAIVNVSSGAAIRVAARMADYNASKAGVASLTRSAAAEVSGQGIRVNAVLPGAVETPMLASAIGDNPDLLTRNAENHPIGRIGQPVEVAETILWLLSDRSSFVTGVTLPVDGGYSVV